MDESPSDPHGEIREPKLTMADIDLKLKEADLALKMLEIKNRPNTWRGIITNPVVIGAFFTAYVGISTAMVSYVTSEHQIDLDARRYVEQARLEEQKSHAAVLLEAIKTGDPDKAAENLKFLIRSKLISDPGGNIRDYLAERKAGDGAILPIPPRLPAPNKP
jgi:hypothetical protein